VRKCRDRALRSRAAEHWLFRTMFRSRRGHRVQGCEQLPEAIVGGPVGPAGQPQPRQVSPARHAQLVEREQLQRRGIAVGSKLLPGTSDALAKYRDVALAFRLARGVEQRSITVPQLVERDVIPTLTSAAVELATHLIEDLCQ